MAEDQREDAPGDVPGGNSVGTAAIRYGATVIITIAILYFAARFVMPLFYR